MCPDIKICKYLCSNLTNMSNFQPLEVVDRGSETQPQSRADQEHLQRDLSALQDRSDRWGMCLSPSKCSNLRVSRSKYIKNGISVHPYL